MSKKSVLVDEEEEGEGEDDEEEAEKAEEEEEEEEEEGVIVTEIEGVVEDIGAFADEALEDDDRDMEEAIDDAASEATGVATVAIEVSWPPAVTAEACDASDASAGTGCPKPNRPTAAAET